MKNFYKIISFIFHPLLMPLIGLYLIFNLGSHIYYVPIPVKRFVYIVVAISSFILPVSITPLLYALKKIKSIYMRSRKERVLPMLISGLFFYGGYYILSLVPSVPAIILKYILGTILTIYVSLAITLFWKISIHMVGIGGLTGGVLAFAYLKGLDIYLMISFLIVIAGFLGSARIYLDAHDPAQVYVGYVLGFLIVFLYIFI